MAWEPPPIPFYLAAPFNCRQMARDARKLLESSAKLSCTSRWIDSHLEGEAHPPNVLRQEALADLEDIRNAQWVIILNTGPSTSGGMHLETGYALGLKKCLIVVGPRTSVFHYLPTLMVVPTVSDVLQFVPPWLVGKRDLALR